MPANRHTPPTRSGYSDPRTPHGVSLTETSRAAGGFFLLHEVGWLPRGLHWHFPRVLSPFWRLYYNPKPGWHVVHRGRPWPLDPAHILLVPDGTVFDCHGAAGIPHFWIHFTLASPLRTPPTEPLTLALTPPLRTLIRHLLTLLRSPTPATVLHHSASALLHQSLASLDPHTLRSHPEKLAALLNHIARHPSADHSNSALARHVGLSEGAFIRWFHSAVGTTPAAHVQRLRIKTAAHALLTTTRSVEDIAASVGFKNRHHFSRIFQQHFHSGPAAYRKR